MYTHFILTTSRRYAVAAMPWAVKIVHTMGGYGGFESLEDYKAWKAHCAKSVWKAKA